MKTLVVVADLGTFKAFRLENSYEFSKPRLQLVTESTNADAQRRLGDEVTDMAGRFHRGAPRNGTMAMSQDERHNLLLEKRKRLVRRLAQRVNSVCREEDVDRCYLAASREIHRQLLDELHPEVRDRIHKVFPADLTKLPQANLIRYFKAHALTA